MTATTGGFALPPPGAVLPLAMDDGAQIVVRRHGNPAGARLFVSHGNGFAIDGYYPFWALLLREFDLVLFDFRNHGHNPPSDPANHHYAQMTRDLDRVVDGVDAAFGPKPKAGLFHSMSARAAMKHAIEIGWRWAALILFDPPNMPPPGHASRAPMVRFESRLAAWARGRRAHFADPADLAENYLASRAAAHWAAGTHHLMARAVLRHDDAAAGWVLACQPALEAAIYEEATTLDLWPNAAALGGPVRLVGADPDLPYGPPTGAANRALAAEGGYDYVAIPGGGHMLQLERPAACVEAARSFLAAHRIRV